MDRSHLIEYAGFRKRFFAYVVDLATVYVFEVIITFPIVFFYIRFIDPKIDKITADLLGSCIKLISIFVYFFYASIMESSIKQATLGKILLGIVVTDIKGNRIGFGQASARNIAKSFSTLTFYIGYLMCGFTKRRQALHDILTECLVIIKD